MNLLIFILSFILFSGFYGLDTNESIGINVLATLEAKNISCDLHDFVKSINNSEDEYKIFIDDLTNYCSNSESTKVYRIICRIILIELEIACSLLNKSRPLPIKYTASYTPTQICLMSKIAYTNNWIWKKLALNEKEQIGSSPIYICSKLTSLNNTLRLARFFYKIAPRVRRADVYNITSFVDRVRINNTNIDQIRQQEQLLINKTNDNSQNIEERTNKTQVVLDLNQGQSELKEEDQNDENIDSENAKNELINQQKEADDEDLAQAVPINEQVSLKKLDETKKNEEGFPLGRAGEQPEREQINERPKPKNLDVESVFKSNDGEERNWVEGKNVENQQENDLHANLNNFHRMKFEENPLIISQSAKKRPLLKLKLSKYHDDDDLSNNLITFFLIFTLSIVIIYLVLHNKNKVLGLIIEGCRRRRAMQGGRFGRHIRLSQSI